MFLLESQYNLGDIDHRYQILYAYYFKWHPNHASLPRHTGIELFTNIEESG